MLQQGTRVGPYEISRLVGAGGMGEVYRARDTSLSRDVAIKVLPAELAADPGRLARFKREAQLLAALNHPNVAAVHGFDHADGRPFLVMEHLEGETLARRLKRGRPPLEESLHCAVEIAAALEAAHRLGIVHRDLKPANVMLTKSGTKLLDFGLAKLTAGKPAADDAETGTEASSLTAEGRVLGTLPYMAPEQVGGKELDARTDIWALGCVLYEMLSGRRAFAGESSSSLAASILRDAPPSIASIEPSTPPALEHLVNACLAKDPDERWQSAHDLGEALRWIASGGHTDVPPSGVSARRALTMAAGATVLGAALLFLAFHQRHKPARPGPVRFTIQPPPEASFSSAPAVSPDGERIAFGATGVAGSQLFVRSLGSAQASPVAGTRGAGAPFWSPDGRQLGFVAGQRLRVIDLASGSARTLSDRLDLFAGASWGPDGTIIFASVGDLYRVPAGGGGVLPLGTRVSGESARLSPHFLPDGRYLYFSRDVNEERQGIYVARLDSKERQRLAVDGSGPAYSPSGHLLFVRGGALMAQAFDTATLRLFGSPVPIAGSVADDTGPLMALGYSLSGAVLAWRTGSPSTTLTWLDRSGKKLGTVGEPAIYSNPALAPDGKSLAVGRLDPATKTRDVWLFDLERGSSTRLTYHPGDDFGPAWSPDGRRIAFTSDRRGVREIYVKPADGSAEEELLIGSTDFWKNVEEWSPDGRFLVYNYYANGKPCDLFLLPVAASQRPIPFLTTPFIEDRGRFAPNGHWLAYDSDESGRTEVYVRQVSSEGLGGGKWKVSTEGGLDAHWRGDGRELFYVAGVASSVAVMAVDVRTDSNSFEAAAPRSLFDLRLATPERRNRLVVTRDGQRFLAVTADESTLGPIEVLVNWLPPSR